MEATIFTGWIYDFLRPFAVDLKVAHPEMLKAITAAKKEKRSRRCRDDCRSPAGKSSAEMPHVIVGNPGVAADTAVSQSRSPNRGEDAEQDCPVCSWRSAPVTQQKAPARQEIF